jgi:hypothetical protein
VIAETVTASSPTATVPHQSAESPRESRVSFVRSNGHLVETVVSKSGFFQFWEEGKTEPVNSIREGAIHQGYYHPRGDVVGKREKAQLAPGLHNHSRFGVAPTIAWQPCQSVEVQNDERIRTALLIVPMRL